MSTSISSSVSVSKTDAEAFGLRPNASSSIFDGETEDENEVDTEPQEEE